MTSNSDNEKNELDKSIVNSKGLYNQRGENNCFLNSAVQVLWHLEVFRKNFCLLNEHACTGEESCIFCAMKILFNHFKHSNEYVLDLTVLRKALARTFESRKKFQLGEMDDASDCFENLLLYMHCHVSYGQPDNFCHSKHCLTHQKFAMNIVEQTVCRCGATSEPFPFVQLIHYISTRTVVIESFRMDLTLNANCEVELFSKFVVTSSPESKRYRSRVSYYESTYGVLKKVYSNSALKHYCCGSHSSKCSARKCDPDPNNAGCCSLVGLHERNNFAQNMRASFQYTDHRSECPSKCGENVSRLCWTLVNRPDVISIGLIWESDDPTSEFVSTFNRLIDEHLKLSDLFHVTENTPKPYDLVGIVCFYGRHYSTFFLHPTEGCWYSFNDARVTKIGEWSKVNYQMCRGKYQPCLLVYQNPDNSLIDTTTAIKKTYHLKDFLHSFEKTQSAMVPLALRRTANITSESAKTLCEKPTEGPRDATPATDEDSDSDMDVDDNTNSNCNIPRQRQRAQLRSVAAPFSSIVNFPAFVPDCPPQVIRHDIKLSNQVRYPTTGMAGSQSSANSQRVLPGISGSTLSPPLIGWGPGWVPSCVPVARGQVYKPVRTDINGLNYFVARQQHLPNYHQPVVAHVPMTLGHPFQSNGINRFQVPAGWQPSTSNQLPASRQGNPARCSVVEMLADAMADEFRDLKVNSGSRNSSSVTEAACPDLLLSGINSDLTLSDWTVVSPVSSPDVRSWSSLSSGDSSNTNAEDSDVSLMTFSLPRGVSLQNDWLAPFDKLAGKKGHPSGLDSSIVDGVKEADLFMDLCSAKELVDKHSALLYCNRALVAYQLALTRLNKHKNVSSEALNYVDRRLNQALAKNQQLDEAIRISKQSRTTPSNVHAKPRTVTPSSCGDLIQLNEAVPSVNHQLLKEQIRYLFSQPGVVGRLPGPSARS